MPRIETPLLLDILLGLVVVLFVPFGIRRGVAKEAMVSAGILLGAVLAGRFAEPWGAQLSARLALEPGAAQFVVSALLLFACTFLLGYGAGAAIGATRQGTFSRLAGGLLAAFNAALLLSYLLRWIDQFLQQGGALDDGIVSEALLRDSDVLLLGAAAVLLAMTLLGWIVSASRSRRQPRETDAAMLAGIPSRQRPVRVASAADGGKYEPEGTAVSRSGRFGPGLDATAPMSSGTAFAEHESWRGDPQTLLNTNGRGGDGQFEAGRKRAAETPSAQRDDSVWSAWKPQASDDVSDRTEPVGHWPVAPSLGVTGDERCAVCRASVGARDVFCPECGATL